MGKLVIYTEKSNIEIILLRMTLLQVFMTFPEVRFPAACRPAPRRRLPKEPLRGSAVC